MNLLLDLFFSFFQVGLFSIGGGYAAMPLIQAQTVEIHSWLTAVEFANLVTIAEMTPGPIAINSATFVGMKVAGIPGVVVATLGNILPSVIIMLILARLYEKYSKQTLLKRVLEGVRPVVVSAIFVADCLVLLHHTRPLCRRSLPCSLLSPEQQEDSPWSHHLVDFGSLGRNW